LNAAIDNVEEGAPLSTRVGTILLGVAAFIAMTVTGTYVYRWARRRGYNLDDD
jgi:hypothetical protein